MDGDLRFISHHDTVRLIERAATRGNLPLRYSQGFNPRPQISLPCPRPVGVSSRDDLLVLSLEEPLEEAELLRRMNENAPPGMSFLRSRKLAPGQSARPRKVQYEWPVPPERLEAVRSRVQELAPAPSWPMERLVSEKHGRGFRPKPIDLRPLVKELRIEGERLVCVLEPKGDQWARPGEVLKLVGGDDRTDLAAVVRTAVDYGISSDGQ